GIGEQPRELGEAAQILEAILFGETEVGVHSVADRVTVEEEAAPPRFVQFEVHEAGDRGLARTAQAGKPYDRAAVTRQRFALFEAQQCPVPFRRFGITHGVTLDDAPAGVNEGAASVHASTRSRVTSLKFSQRRSTPSHWPRRAKSVSNSRSNRARSNSLNSGRFFIIQSDLIRSRTDCGTKRLRMYANPGMWTNASRHRLARMRSADTFCASISRHVGVPG